MPEQITRANGDAQNPYSSPAATTPAAPAPGDFPSLGRRTWLAVGLGLVAFVVDLVVPIPLIKSALIGVVCGRWIARRTPAAQSRRARRAAAWMAVSAVGVEITLGLLIVLALAAVSGYARAMLSAAPDQALLFFVPISLALELGLTALFAWEVARRAHGRHAPRAPAEDERACPECGAPYRLRDYRRDAEIIHCAACKAALPGPAAPAPVPTPTDASANR